MDSARGSENLDRGTTGHLAGFVGGAPVLGWGCQAHMGPARPRQSLGKDLRARLVAHLFSDVGGDTPGTDVLVCDPPPARLVDFRGDAEHGLSLSAHFQCVPPSPPLKPLFCPGLHVGVDQCHRARGKSSGYEAGFGRVEVDFDFEVEWDSIIPIPKGDFCGKSRDCHPWLLAIPLVE